MKLHIYALQQNITNGLANLRAGLKIKFDNALLKYGAWFPVLVAIVLMLAFTLVAATAFWLIPSSFRSWILVQVLATNCTTPFL